MWMCTFVAQSILLRSKSCLVEAGDRLYVVCLLLGTSDKHLPSKASWFRGQPYGCRLTIPTARYRGSLALITGVRQTIRRCRVLNEKKRRTAISSKVFNVGPIGAQGAENDRTIDTGRTGRGAEVRFSLRNVVQGNIRRDPRNAIGGGFVFLE